MIWGLKWTHLSPLLVSRSVTPKLHSECEQKLGKIDKVKLWHISPGCVRKGLCGNDSIEIYEEKNEVSETRGYRLGYKFTHSTKGWRSARRGIDSGTSLPPWKPDLI